MHFPPNHNNNLRIFHGDIDEVECMRAALRAARDSFWCVVNAEKDLFCVDRKLRMCAAGNWM